MNFNFSSISRRPVEKSDERFKQEYDINYLSKVIEYNHNKYLAFKNDLPFTLIKEYEKILKARYQKCSRIKRRFIWLLSRHKYIWFITFTFSDNYINKSDRTKRDLMKSVLKTNDFKFILNIDYGKTTEREHYHCILGTNEDIDVNKLFQDNYKGGFSKSILCKYGFSDFQRLVKYINKLTNHCIKASTKRQRLLYNFKGYDLLAPTPHDVTILYKKELEFLFDNFDFVG